MNDQLGNILGEEIRKLRALKGITQSELAEKVETTTNTISAIELGNRIPRAKLLSRISTFFDVPYEFFQNLLNQRQQYLQESTAEFDDNHNAEVVSSVMKKMLTGRTVRVAGQQVPINIYYKIDYQHLIYTLVVNGIFTFEEVTGIAYHASKDLLRIDQKGYKEEDLKEKATKSAYDNSL